MISRIPILLRLQRTNFTFFSVLLLIWKSHNIEDAWVALEGFNFYSQYYKNPILRKNQQQQSVILIVILSISQAVAPY